MSKVAGLHQKHAAGIVLVALTMIAGGISAQEVDPTAPETAPVQKVEATPLQEQIAAQRATIEQLRKTYSEGHPEVVLANHRLEQLRAQAKDAESATPRTEPASRAER